MVNWGFIGCGAVTEKKSGPAFRKVEGSDVVAVMRRDTAKAKDYALRHGIGTWYDNASELINDPRVNAVYVATPPGSHAKYAIQAMNAGKSVYIEKPMAASYDECVEIQRVSEATGVPCFVAYYRRTLPYFGRVKKLIEEENLGTLSTVQIRFAIPPYATDYDKDNLPWRVKKELSGAGYFYDLASHQLDLLDWLFGEISDAYGYSENRGGLYDVEDTVVGYAFNRDCWAVEAGALSPQRSRTDLIEVVTRGSSPIFTFCLYVWKPPRVKRFVEKNQKYNSFDTKYRRIPERKRICPPSTAQTAARATG